MYSALLAQNQDFKFDSGIYFDIEDSVGGGSFKFPGASIGTVVSTTIPYLFFLAGIALLLYLIAGGYALMFSGGDPKKVAGAKSQITNALLGIFIVFISFWAVQLISIFLGLPSIMNVF